jgi:hypothetical protein
MFSPLIEILFGRWREFLPPLEIRFAEMPAKI